MRVGTTRYFSVNSSSPPPEDERLVSQRSYHYSLLHCYLNRCSRLRTPFGAEQACIVGPLLALICRHFSFGHLAMLTLERLCPQILLSKFLNLLKITYLLTSSNYSVITPACQRFKIIIQKDLELLSSK